MLKRIIVNEVKEPPVVMVVMQGIRTKEEAEHWAEKNGFLTVYWIKNRQRVYAFRNNDHPVAVSQPLFAPSERGQGLLEFLFCLAIVAIVIFVVLKDRKW